MVNVKDVQLGTTTRKSFAKINEVMKMPNLIEVQKSSYRWFLEEGLKEVFKDIGEISDYTGNLVLDFVDFSIDDEPKYSIAQCKARDTTYARPLKVRARLVNKETGEIKENTIFMGDLPWMTDAGTFVINGAERCIVSQLVRSPGVYYNMDHDKTGKELFTNTVIPNRGAWLEYETDALVLILKSLISLAKMKRFLPQSIRILLRTPRRLFLKFIKNFVRVSRQPLKQHRLILTVCSLMLTVMTFQESADINIIKSFR